MLRRVTTIVLAPLALVGALSGCTTFSDGDAVARVNDTEMSTDLLDDLTTILGPQADSVVGTGVNADASRNLIAQWVQVAVVEAHLDEIGLEITADARERAAEAVEGDPTLSEISDGARDYLLDAQAAIEMFNGLPDPQASFEQTLDTVDVYVNARYGFFDPQFGVLPLGFAPTADS